MWKCPICSKNMKNEYTCASCGYDHRKDFVQLRTLCMIPKADVEEYIAFTSEQQDFQKEIYNETSQEKTVQEENKENKKRKQIFPKILLVLLCARLIVSLISNMTYSFAQTLSDITLYIGVAVMLMAPAAVLILVVRAVRKKTVKKLIYFIVICAVVFVICVVISRHAMSVVNYYEMICQYDVSCISFL